MTTSALFTFKSLAIRLLALLLLSAYPVSALQAQTSIWSKHEIHFTSTLSYDNPLYEVSDFRAIFTAPSGRMKTVGGFWDGGSDWKIRFMPDEIGTWTWKSHCSDKSNTGLDAQSGTFECVENDQKEGLFQKGAIRHEPGTYYLSHADGTPFFWLACTAWNGAPIPHQWI